MDFAIDLEVDGEVCFFKGGIKKVTGRRVGNLGERELKYASDRDSYPAMVIYLAQIRRDFVTVRAAINGHRAPTLVRLSH